MESNIKGKQEEIRLLNERIREYTELAISLKQRGETQEALQTMRHLKVMKVELATHRKLLDAYMAAAGHSVSSGGPQICSMLVLKYEIEQAKGRGDQQAGKQLRKEARSLEAKITSGRLTQDQYCCSLEESVANLKAKADLTSTEAVHLELMQSELRHRNLDAPGPDDSFPQRS